MRYDNINITEIAGYHLTERIGSGGMGDVYRAYNAALKRTAAVKILHQKSMAERFRNEAYIQSSVSHPNIACLYEYLISGDTPCIIMEYVEGETLDSYMHKRGRLSNQETEDIIQQVSSALAYLHSKGILHRDIKPQNFKIQPNGTVTMLDFGISKNKYTPKLTQLGFIVGTTEYMAPEQFQQKVEKKSDIWSLGVMAYELITGYLPFESDNPVTLRAKIEKGNYTNPEVLVPQLSEKLNNIIDKSLKINPAVRISAHEIEKLFNKKHWQQTEKNENQAKKWIFGNRKNNRVVIFTTLFLCIILYLKIKNTDSDIVPTKDKHEDSLISNNNIEAPDIQKLTIAVPNAPNAVIVFPDGSSKKLPYDIAGKEGQSFQFTLQADGYVSRIIEVPITIRRKSYEYNLEKIKE